MDHLRTLRILNLVMAVLTGLAAATFLVVFGIVGLLMVKDGKQEGFLFASGGTIVAVLFGAFAALHGWLASKLEQGRGRVLQTVVAVLNLSNFPLGTLYGGYALWIVWMEPTCKAFFDRHEGKVF